MEKENHLQVCGLGKGYVSSQERRCTVIVVEDHIAPFGFCVQYCDTAIDWVQRMFSAHTSD